MTHVNLHANAEISFEADADLVKALIVDLQSEQQSLIHADLDAIESVVDNRVELLQALGEAANLRYASLAAAGFEPNEAGMAKWAALNHGAMLDTKWQEFQKNLAIAKELNRLNGVLIGKHFQRNQEKLDALNGKTSAPQFYGKNGQAHRANTARSSYSV